MPRYHVLIDLWFDANTEEKADEIGGTFTCAGIVDVQLHHGEVNLRIDREPPDLETPE